LRRRRNPKQIGSNCNEEEEEENEKENISVDGSAHASIEEARISSGLLVLMEVCTWKSPN
jgi:hypothetical protein